MKVLEDFTKVLLQICSEYFQQMGCSFWCMKVFYKSLNNKSELININQILQKNI